MKTVSNPIVFLETQQSLKRTKVEEEMGNEIRDLQGVSEARTERSCEEGVGSNGAGFEELQPIVKLWNESKGRVWPYFHHHHRHC